MLFCVCYSQTVLWAHCMYTMKSWCTNVHVVCALCTHVHSLTCSRKMKCTYSKAVQGRSKHLETGPDVNTVKPHPLINDITSFNQGLAMHRSHCHGLNRGHSFYFHPICALGKLLVHCLFGNIILYRWIGDTACCCGRAEVRVSGIARRRKCVWRRRVHQQQVVRAAPNVLFIIHYLRMRSSKNYRENWSGQKRTSRTACYGHVYHTWYAKFSVILSVSLHTQPAPYYKPKTVSQSLL